MSLNFEGICMMCRRPLLVHTIGIDGKMRPFCPVCLEKVEKKTKQAMDKRGVKVSGKGIVFHSAKE